MTTSRAAAARRTKKRAPARAAPRPHSRVRRILVAAFDGDRPLVAGLVAVLAFGVMTTITPLQRLLDTRERTAQLRQQVDTLHHENAKLDQRVADLNDPSYLELLAREELGLVKPGEIPFVVVAPEPERPQIAPAEQQPPPPAPWYRRLWRGISGLFE